MCVKFPSAAVEPNLGPGYPSTYTLHFLPMVYLFIYIFFLSCAWRQPYVNLPSSLQEGQLSHPLNQNGFLP